MEKVVKQPDGCWVFTGAKRDGGYGEISRGRAKEGIACTHRVVYEALVGPIPAGKLLDHRCRIPSCCNPDHLRIVTVKQNGEHLRGARRDNKSSGVRGVTWQKKNKSRPWQGQVHHNGKCIYVGGFATIQEAEAAVIAKRAEIFTHDDYEQWIINQKEKTS